MTFEVYDPDRKCPKCGSCGEPQVLFVRSLSQISSQYLAKADILGKLMVTCPTCGAERFEIPLDDAPVDPPHISMSDLLPVEALYPSTEPMSDSLEDRTTANPAPYGPDSKPETTEEHLLSWAWTIMANAGEGNWEMESAAWRKAAERWREEWRAHMNASAGRVSPAQAAPALFRKALIDVEESIEDLVNNVADARHRIGQVRALAEATTEATDLPAGEFRSAVKRLQEAVRYGVPYILRAGDESGDMADAEELRTRLRDSGIPLPDVEVLVARHYKRWLDRWVKPPLLSLLDLARIDDDGLGSPADLFLERMESGAPPAPDEI